GTAVTRSKPSRFSVVSDPATTWAPSASSACVTAHPMPLFAPVTDRDLVREPEIHDPSFLWPLVRLRDSDRRGPGGVAEGPVECVVGDFLPALLAERVVRAAWELLELGDRI